MNKALEQLRKEISSNLESTITKFKQNGVVIWGTGSSGLAFKRFLEDFDALEEVTFSFIKKEKEKLASGVTINTEIEWED